MEVAVARSVWDSVFEITKVAQEKGIDPLTWAIQLSSKLTLAGVSLPSPELAHLLVSHICWENNVPIAWKSLEKALSFKIVPPFLILALLSTRVIPNRLSRPAAFRIYMELLKRHAFTLKSSISCSNYEKTMNSIDNVLHLSQIVGLQAGEPGIVLVGFIFSIVWQLLDASLEDEGLLELTPDKKPMWASIPQDMEVGHHDHYEEKWTECQQMLQRINTVMAIELIGQFLQNQVTAKILYLARHNMPTHWRSFVQRLQLLIVNSSSLRNSKVMTPEVLVKLISEDRKICSPESKSSYLQDLHAKISSGSLASSAGLCHGANRSALWLPLDLMLEDAMDGSQATTTSAVEIIFGLMKALQAFNGTSWHQSFLGLWMAALRLVQRERDPIEGPVPRLETRMCMLLSITTLVVSDLIEEEESTSNDDHIQCSTKNHCVEQVPWKRRKELVSSLQSLGDYQSLLTPPQSVIPAANQAAAKAMISISGINVGTAYLECISMKDMPTNCSGNLHHLIVEACIARNLLDTSAYFWPGYVNGRMNQIPHGVPPQVPGWSSFMKGAPLTPVMINALVSSPATSRAGENI